MCSAWCLCLLYATSYSIEWAGCHSCHSDHSSRVGESDEGTPHCWCGCVAKARLWHLDSTRPDSTRPQSILLLLLLQLLTTSCIPRFLTSFSNHLDPPPSLPPSFLSNHPYPYPYLCLLFYPFFLSFSFSFSFSSSSLDSIASYSPASKQPCSSTSLLSPSWLPRSLVLSPRYGPNLCLWHRVN
jgi:hypothetical protein